MQFQPKTEAQMDAERLLPAGDYDFEVRHAEDAVSKSGKDMVKLTLCIFHGGGERTVFDYLMEAALYRMRHFCYGVGIGAAYEAGQVTAQECIGRGGRVSLRVENQPGYQPKNSVADYIVPAATKEVSSAAKTLPAPAMRAAGLPGAVPVGGPTDEPPF